MDAFQFGSINHTLLLKLLANLAIGNMYIGKQVPPVPT